MTNTKQKTQHDVDTLFREHNDKLVASVFRRIGADKALIEDACAFAWMQLVRTPPDHDQVLPWLIVVARNEALRLLSKQDDVSLDTPANADVEEGEALADQLPGTADTARAVELLDALEAVAELSPRRREVFRLHLSGFSYEEIEEATGYSHGAINALIVKARRQLRKSHGDRGE